LPTLALTMMQITPMTVLAILNGSSLIQQGIAY